MPQVFIVLAVIWEAIASSAVLSSLFALGASVLLGAVSKLFAKGPSVSSLTNQAASRTVTSRQTVAPWRVLYGTNRVGGIITFVHTTGATNEKLPLLMD